MTTTRTRRTTGLGALLLGATTLLTACGGAASQENAEGLTEVSVGTIPAVLSAPLFLGIEEGIFEEHGLDLEVNFADGGAAVIPSVLSGENQFGYSNTVSQLAALGEGLPLEIVHSSWAPHAEFEDDDHGILVRPDSGIDEPSGLAGKNIAVNTLQNIGEVHIRKAFEDLGIDHEGLQWTQLPFPDMAEALERGDVDAIWVSEPFRTPAMNQGYELLMSAGAQAFPEQVGGYYSTSEQYAAQNPDVVKAFKEAMVEVNDFAEHNPDLVRQVAVEEMGIDEDVAERMTLPLFPNDDDVEALQSYAEYAVRFGILSKAPEDFEALFATQD
ncbi:nitrate ABC transporter substrate-binding protein [Aeromicrobium phragmitis]|uniref:Nitrate ABC transporter substrate-binding protein n=1 Tax=Aeromicrobium phragmitis TaxID=2478914 RepID=A0A3L8PRJ7_9ACTN|nr:ABC transporter substrate-binding protein [Aeromicrobium phragmitis]RLV57008.1 nitrate ABC transporter substrate-binding protein [Aeromicrobium phragmitis]